MEISDGDDILLNDLIALCAKHNYVGVAVSFRHEIGYTTLCLEHPDFADGECKQLRQALTDAITNQLACFNGELVEGKKMTVSGPAIDPDEMPH